MKTRNFVAIAAAVLGGAAAFVSLQSHAAVVAYTNRATWLAAVGPLSGTEDFNSFATDVSFQNAVVPLNNMTVTGTVGSNGPLTQRIDAPPLEFGGVYSVSGTGHILGDLAGPNQFLRFDFVTPVVSWGVDTVGIGNAPRTTRIEVYSASNALLGSVQTSSATDQTPGFYGFDLTSDAASYLVFVNSNGDNDAFGLDNIAFVNVPEPMGLAPLAAAIVALGTWTRRRTLTRNFTPVGIGSIDSNEDL